METQAQDNTTPAAPSTLLGSAVTPSPAPAPAAPAQPAAAPAAPAQPDPAKPADPAKPVEKPAEPAKPAVPEKYEFKLPEGMTVDQKLVDVSTPVFKELGLNQDQAAKLAAVYAEHQIGLAKAAETEVKATLDKWKAEVKAWPEADQRLRSINRMLLKHGDGEIQKLFAGDEYLGSNPVVLRLLDRLARALGEDQPVETGKTSPAVRPAEDVLYPSMKK